MSDLISRQVAIDAIEEKACMTIYEDEISGLVQAKKVLESLPSAEVCIKQNAIESVAENLGKMYGVEASEMMEQARQWIEG